MSVHLGVPNFYTGRFGCGTTDTKYISTACRGFWRKSRRPERTLLPERVTCEDCKRAVLVCDRCNSTAPALETDWVLVLAEKVVAPRVVETRLVRYRPVCPKCILPEEKSGRVEE